MSRIALRPRALEPGSTIGVCSPSGPVEADTLEVCSQIWHDAGYRVRIAPHAFERRGFLAGHDDERLADLLALWRDPSVDAIVASRGGYGLTRLLHRLPAEELRRERKLYIGHSDSTALLLWLRECAGMASLHGPMLQRTDWSPESQASVLALARGEGPETKPLQGAVVRGGRASGVLVGGNLSLVLASLGTDWEIDTQGAILFFEDVGEQPYALDRALVQLENAGKLACAAGVAVGQLVDCESRRYPDASSRSVIEERLGLAFSGPVVVDLPFGHCADNRSMPVGTLAEIDGATGTLALLEPVTEICP
jgi:muramoyltetrapeptide carboxypeptidase